MKNQVLCSVAVVVELNVFRTAAEFLKAENKSVATTVVSPPHPSCLLSITESIVHHLLSLGLG